MTRLYLYVGSIDKLFRLLKCNEAFKDTYTTVNTVQENHSALGFCVSINKAMSLLQRQIRFPEADEK